MQSYPLVETIQKDNICHIVVAPAQVPPNAVADALQIAKQAIASLPGGFFDRLMCGKCIICKFSD